MKNIKRKPCCYKYPTENYLTKIRNESLFDSRFFSPCNSDGASIYMTQLAKSLQESSLEVIVITTKPWVSRLFLRPSQREFSDIKFYEIYSPSIQYSGLY